MCDGATCSQCLLSAFADEAVGTGFNDFESVGITSTCGSTVVGFIAPG